MVTKHAMIPNGCDGSWNSVYTFYQHQCLMNGGFLKMKLLKTF